MKPKRTLKVKDGLLDLSFLGLSTKQGLFPLLYRAVGFYIAMKILFGSKKEEPKKHNQMIGMKK